MYCDFYGMRERPFNVTADPRFLYLNGRYREALASLQYGISQRKGFVTLIGEAGTGKTTLLKKLLDDLDPATRTVFIFNTNVTFDEILEYTFSELDLPVNNGKRLYMLQRLNDYLLDELRSGRNVALLIDEAQDLDYSVLEDLRLLSNLETATEKILQIVLSGQPELGDKLGDPKLRQLRQRIAVNCRLVPLSREELSEYIQSRLAAAGCSEPKLFSREAEDRVFELSHGIPRLVNVLCDNALVIGYALGKKRVGADVVNEAAADLLPGEAGKAAGAAPAPALADEPAIAAPAPVRRVSSAGIVAVVVVAIVVGLLSVGRTLLRSANDAATSEASIPSDVIQPGTRLAQREPAVIEPRAAGAVGRVVEEVVPVEEAPRPARDSVPAIEALDRAPSERADVEGTAEDRWVEPQEEVREEARADEVREPAVAAAKLPLVPERPAGERVGTTTQWTWPPPRTDPEGPAQAGREPEPRVAAVEGDSLAALAEPEPVGHGEQAGGLDSAPEPGQPGEPPEGADYRVAQSRYRRVVVGRGDSFSAIAVRTYGQSSDTILDLMKLANPSVQDVNVIPIGKELRLPEFEGGLVFLQDRSDQFDVLLLSTAMRGRANEIAAALRLRGFEARVVPGNLSASHPVWRVLVGGFSSRDQAQSAGRRLRQLFREDERMAAMAR
jgi:general secretion pathway protein A